MVTASPPGTPLADAGVLGAPSTTVLIGNEDVNDELFSGGTLRATLWLDDFRTWAIQGDFLYAARQSSLLVAGSDGTGIVGRPFVDAASGANAAQLVSFPGLLAGTTSVNTTTDPIYGVGASLRRVIYRVWNEDECGGPVTAFEASWLAGYRFLRIDEELVIQENLLALDPLALGTRLIVTDRFGTRNIFNGGEVGVQADYTWNRLSLEVAGRLAIGSTYRRLSIGGSTQVLAPGFAAIVNDGGLYALSSNSGVHASTVFSLVPQAEATVGYQLTPRLRGTVGYTALWWTNVLRPGEQIDPVVNPNLLPPILPGGPARPTVLINDSTLWLHGIRFGVELRF